MLSSKTLCFSSTLPMSMLQSSSRTLSTLTLADLRLGGRCYSCINNTNSNPREFRRCNTFEQTFFKNAPSRIFSSKRGRDTSYANQRPESSFGIIDVEEIEDDDSDHVNNSSSTRERVKVKFNWKNSLVSTDSVKLLGNLYQTHPQLIEFDESDLVHYLEKMSTYSIDVDKAAKMAIMDPRLIKISEETIGKCIAALRSIGLGENQRAHVLRSVPQLLSMPSKRLIEQFSFLKTYFSSQESVDVVCKSVEVFLESETTLREKLEYLIKDMSHETKNLVNCKAISSSLRHIKTRHEFLIRCGLFKPIPYRKLIKVLEKDYKDRNKPRNKYFKPIEIVCYNDEDFLKICTKNQISLNELAAFEELYGAELDVIEGDVSQESDDTAIEHGDGDEKDDAQESVVSLVRTPNSVGFFNDIEAKSCYF